MQWNRREFLTTSSLALAAGALRIVPVRGQAQQAPPQVSFRELRGGVGIFLGRGGTIGWAISPDALIVVDSQFPDTAQLCLDGLKQRSSRTIDALVSSHHHTDHTSGNAVFKPFAKMIVAHDRVPELQRKQAEAAGANAAPQAYPDTTFKDSWRRSFGKVTVLAKHYGPAHTGGDAVTLFEEANVAHMGDLMFNHRHPRIDRPAGALIRGWITSLEKITAELGDSTTYVAGHAKDGLDVVVKRADLLAFRDYFSRVLETVGQGIKAGQSKEQITSLKTLRGFEDYAENPPNLTLAAVLGVAYDELTT